METEAHLREPGGPNLIAAPRVGVVALSVSSESHSTAEKKCATSIAIERRKLGRGMAGGGVLFFRKRCWHNRSPFFFSSPVAFLLPSAFYQLPPTARSFITVKDQKFVDENCNDYVVAG